MTGFIPAGRDSPCKYVNHQGTLSSSELKKGKVQGKRCEEPGQTKTLGSRGTGQKRYQIHVRGDFLVLGGGLRKAREQEDERLASEARGGEVMETYHLGDSQAATLKLQTGKRGAEAWRTCP